MKIGRIDLSILVIPINPATNPVIILVIEDVRVATREMKSMYISK